MLHECMKMLFYDCKPDESDRADWSISVAAGGSPADFIFTHQTIRWKS